MGAEIRLNGQSLVDSLPAESGVYLTSVGEVGIELRVSRDKEVQEVILDCSRAPVLQGKKGKEQRVINLGSKGKGSQQISETDLLEYDLGRRIHPAYRMRPVEYDVHLMGQGHRVKTIWVPTGEIWER